MPKSVRRARDLISLIFVLCFSSTQAAGTNYEGLWWNPNESGWGVTLTHQGSTIFGTWFIYGPDGKPFWVSATLRQVGVLATFSGPLYRTTGTPYSTPGFNPGETKGVIAGTATASFQATNRLSLTYTVDGVASAASLTRQTLTSIGIDGVYTGLTIGVGAFDTDQTTFTVTTALDGTFFLEQASFISGTCRFSGSSAQVGSRIAASGTYQCSNFSSGTWTSDDLTLFDGLYLLGTFTLRNGSTISFRNFMAVKFK
jgi:hypothetical protein